MVVACVMGASETVRQLLAMRANADALTVAIDDTEQLFQCRPLVTACRYNQPKCVSLLLAAGVSLEAMRTSLTELEAFPSFTECLKLVRREYPTDIGPVDLMCRDAEGIAVAVEVKRRGEIDGVEQLTRYLEFLNRDPLLRPVRGVFVAQEIKPQAKVLAADRDIDWVEVDYDELRGIESPNLKLF